MKLKVRIVDIGRHSDAFISLNDYEKIFGTREFYNIKGSFVKINGHTYNVSTGIYHPDDHDHSNEIELMKEGCVSFSKRGGSALIAPFDGQMVDVVEVSVAELVDEFWERKRNNT